MSRSDLLQLTLKLLGAAWRPILEETQRHPWTVAVALYGLARAFGVMIQSGQRGVLFRWGKAVKELEPGFHWLIPLVDDVKKTPVRSVTIHLPGQKVMTMDGLVYDVSVSVVYRVEDATRALTLVDHVDAGCRAAISIDVVSICDYDLYNQIAGEVGDAITQLFDDTYISKANFDTDAFLVLSCAPEHPFYEQFISVSNYLE